MKSLSHRLRCRFGVLFPRTALVLNYIRKIHRWPRLRNPRTLNEKIQWLKLHGDNAAIAALADKFAVRNFVAPSPSEAMRFAIPVQISCSVS